MVILGISRNTPDHHLVYPVPIHINHFIALPFEVDMIAGPGDPVQDVHYQSSNRMVLPLFFPRKCLDC